MRRVKTDLSQRIRSGVKIYGRNSPELKDVVHTSDDEKTIEGVVATFQKQQKIKHAESLRDKPYTPGFNKIVEEVRLNSREIMPQVMSLGAAAIRKIWGSEFVVIDAGVTASGIKNIEYDQNRLFGMHQAGLFDIAFLVTPVTIPSEVDEPVTRSQERTGELRTFVASELDVPILEVNTIEIGPSNLDEMEFVIKKAVSHGILPARHNDEPR